VAVLVVLTIGLLRQSRQDPVIGSWTIPNPGIENSSPGLQIAIAKHGHSIILHAELNNNNQAQWNTM